MSRQNHSNLQIRTRIAPSPTGKDLHIGNAYTALINFIFARQNKGNFIIRVEDTDQTRLVEGSEDRILDSLKWLGLDYDEGPDKKNVKFGAYRQSERLEIYEKYSQKLIDEGKAYYCFCSAQRLEKMREEQKLGKLPTMYDGLCKKSDRIKAREKVNKGEKHVIRLNVPDEGATEFHDAIRGKISFENALVDDQVLIKSDGFPTYHFGVVVDDHLMEISHIIRGEEWISSVPKHILLYQAFGWNPPVFAHLPLLRNPDKSKLSKRKNPVWVSWYKNEGFLPEAVLNYLGLMGWSMPDGRDKFSLSEMKAEFKLEDIKTTAPIFDIEKLKWLNKRYIQDLSEDQFRNLVGEYSKYKDHPNFRALIKACSSLVMPRINTLKEFDAMAGFYFKPPIDFEMDVSGKGNLFKRIAAGLKDLNNDDWKTVKIGDNLAVLAKESGLSNSDFFMLLRVAITGRKISPPLNESMEILGKEEVLERLWAI